MREITAVTATTEIPTVQGADLDEAGRRSQIVRAAAAVLGRQGYAETSLKDVAREAGVAPGSSTTTSNPRRTCSSRW